MAFDRSNPGVSLPIRFRGCGAEVELPDGGERSVVVNMAMRPWVKAGAGGQFLPTTTDPWGRVEVRVPSGVTRFEVFYQLPWRRGMLIGGCLMVGTLVGVGWMKRRLTSQGSVVQCANSQLSTGGDYHAVPSSEPAI
jgi:hypothetical protein